MRGLNGSKATTTPEVQLSPLHNKRVQNEARGTRRVPVYLRNCLRPPTTLNIFILPIAPARSDNLHRLVRRHNNDRHTKPIREAHMNSSSFPGDSSAYLESLMRAGQQSVKQFDDALASAMGIEG